MKNRKSENKYRIRKGNLEMKSTIWNNIWFTIKN